MESSPGRERKQEPLATPESTKGDSVIGYFRNIETDISVEVVVGVSADLHKCKWILILRSRKRMDFICMVRVDSRYA
ncbi:hypothetical protein Tco_1457437 [Tanacetum coccineum]